MRSLNTAALICAATIGIACCFSELVVPCSFTPLTVADATNARGGDCKKYFYVSCKQIGTNDCVNMACWRTTCTEDDPSGPIDNATGSLRWCTHTTIHGCDQVLQSPLPCNH